MIEKAVSYQLTKYLRDNDVEESLQSAYKTFHSTETALVKAHNDVVSAIDNQSYIILLLLDLSAAFDTVNHKILLQRLLLDLSAAFDTESQDSSAETLLSLWY